jgi:diaminohydroxyphosphoribosylaminopyrimidine deaminase/5-amino-6-(5-phosphoribosylamino)uracil reductase
MNQDIMYMKEAIALARQGLGRTAPNPPVGAVVVKDGKIAGRGFHPKAGMPHAEVYALEEAGGQARGATLYVTLEPCDHFGRTPPCTRAVIDAGISRVAVGCVDPNPAVSGRGIARLRESGIEVTAGVCEDEAKGLIAWYAHWLEKKQPFVILKAAMTLDGRIAASSGDSKWISSEESRALVHELRNRIDGLLVGIGTVMKDDPLLTCRLEGGRNPRRIILDPAFQIDAQSQCLGEGTILFTASDNDRPEISGTGMEIVRMESDAAGLLPWDRVLGRLGSMGMHAVMVEGGSGVFTSLLRSGCVDEFMLFVAPRILGGGIPLVDLGPTESIAQALKVVITDTRQIGTDVLIEAVPEERCSQGS